jgi:glycosyltransferase involved in cell wall biosynthesis
MFDLPTLILTLRPDLQQHFGSNSANSRERFIGWLLTNGTSEYLAIGEDTGLKTMLTAPTLGKVSALTQLQSLILQCRPDVCIAFPLPAKLPKFLDWFYTHGVEECGVWPFLTATEKHKVLALPAPWASRLSPIITSQPSKLQKSIPLGKRKFGINIIGYAFGQLGIGEDMRMAARALEAAKVPLTMLNFPPGADIPQNDRSMAAHVKPTGEFAINMFCMTAEENGRFYAERGSAQFNNRYTIGYWPWELPKWPKPWEMMLELVDEVWVSSQHTFDALAPICKKPLFIMPMAVHLGEVKKFASRAQARKHFGLPPKAKLFCFSFDLNSYVARKNPEACVSAFLKAFPLKAPARSGSSTGSNYAAVGLVIKASKPAKPNAAWDKLKAQAAKDPRIHIIESTLQRPELLALYRSCNCFLSLHRAEGFGRGLAEALQLGLHVICTGYSGNMDFCKPPHADLVRYKLVKVGKQEYVHSQGQAWAEPDVAHAARLMRKFAKQPAKNTTKKWPEFSVETIGKRYRERLEEIKALIDPKSKNAATKR